MIWTEAQKKSTPNSIISNRSDPSANTQWLSKHEVAASKEPAYQANISQGDTENTQPYGFLICSLPIHAEETREKSSYLQILGKP